MYIVCIGIRNTCFTTDERESLFSRHIVIVQKWQTKKGYNKWKHKKGTWIFERICIKVEQSTKMPKCMAFFFIRFFFLLWQSICLDKFSMALFWLANISARVEYQQQNRTYTWNVYIPYMLHYLRARDCLCLLYVCVFVRRENICICA